MKTKDFSPGLARMSSKNFSYRRLPPATPDEWGDVEAVQDEATVELLGRLAVEEQAAGGQGW